MIYLTDTRDIPLCNDSSHSIVQGAVETRILCGSLQRKPHTMKVYMVMRLEADRDSLTAIAEPRCVPSEPAKVGTRLDHEVAGLVSADSV